VQYENSKQIDPKNPAVWNNLANYYGEHGPLTNAFVYYTEAIRLNPNEPVYYQNFATTVYLYRTDVKSFYHLNEQQTFDKALGLYQQAMKLAPDNFLLSCDYAMSYYGIKPLRTNDALVAWTNSLNLAHNENERQGVLIHLARVKVAAGLYDDAQTTLNSVTNAEFAVMRKQQERSLADHKNPPPETPEVTVTNNSAVPLTNAALTNQVAFLTNAANGLPKIPDLRIAPPALRSEKPQ
jgi:tetratricopeptide (TPR) repeat protein